MEKTLVKKWFMIHTYSGYEKKVKTDLEKKIETLGIGTIVEEGKEVLTVDGKKYILEKPLRADVALLNGSVVDELGNVIYAKTTKNFNPMMATAADTVIVFAEKLVKVGEIDPDHVMTSRIFVDYIVK